MKYLLSNLGVNLTSIIAISIAGYLAANDKNGWGWFIVVALLCAGSVSFKESKVK